MDGSAFLVAGLLGFAILHSPLTSTSADQTAPQSMSVHPSVTLQPILQKDHRVTAAAAQVPKEHVVSRYRHGFDPPSNAGCGRSLIVQLRQGTFVDILAKRWQLKIGLMRMLGALPASDRLLDWCRYFSSLRRFKLEWRWYAIVEMLQIVRNANINVIGKNLAEIGSG